MKKLAALFLVLISLLSLVSAAFTDQNAINETHAEAVNAMVEAKVISGFPDGSFQPKGTLTRAQAAKIITVLLEGDKADSVTAANAGFTDVPAGNWAEKYINYCAEKKIVSGVGSGKFNPNGTLTGAQWAKMLLVAYGHDAAELTGEKWFSNTQKAIKDKGMDKRAFTSDAPTNREKACQLAYNFYSNIKLLDFESKVLAPAGYKQTTISLAGGKNVKLLGRAEATEKGVITNFPADGLEFKLDCGGTLKIAIDAADTNNAYQLFVDGQVAGEAVWSKSKELTLTTLLQPGEHTIRIVQDKEISTKGSVNTISAITVSTKGGEMQATPLNKYFIQFIGASCEAGCGTLGGPKDDWKPEVHSATHSHCYYTAEALGADYSVVAKGGIGLMTEVTNVSSWNLYRYRNAYRDKNTLYTPTRQPDIIVSKIPGPNDNVDAYTEDQLFEQGKIYHEELRKLHPNAKIVLIYGNMSDTNDDNASNAKRRIAAALGGEAKGVYTLELPRGKNGVPAKKGGNPHPSAEDCRKQAEVEADFLKTILK